MAGETDTDKTIWTVGHSTLPIGDFTELLRGYGIGMVADIRSMPGSRRYPQYNRENLERELPAAGVGYRTISELGGRRKAHRDSLNTEWDHPAFRGYADYMETPAFRHGIEVLTETALRVRTAFMCAEAVWWRCHRAMVSDYLKAEGWRVLHILGRDKWTEHPYTAAAHIVNGKLSYRALL